MAANFDITTNKGLGQLNGLLKDKSYVQGYLPSSADLELFQKFSEEPKRNFVNVYRWYKHIASFSEEEQKAWVGGDAQPNNNNNNNKVEEKPPKKEEADDDDDDDDDDLDLFGDDDDDDFDAEYEKELERKAQEHLAKKAAKGKKVIDKSAVVFDVKPFDSETDLKILETQVRGIEMDGLKWGEAKFEDIAFGIQKIVIGSVIVDDLVSTDDLVEQIEEFDDVQSVDVVSFSKCS